MKTNSAISRVLLASLFRTTLLTVASPAINAQETTSSQNNARGLNSLKNQETLEEVTSYKEFKNTDGPVSINPAKFQTRN